MFDAKTLDQMLRDAFDPLVGESVRIATKGTGKRTEQVIDGWVEEVYPHGVLIRRRWQIEVAHGDEDDDGSGGREFISFVDFYTLHARVLSGRAKLALEIAMPHIRNAALLQLRNVRREVLPAVAVGD